jgi:homoserine dehydrogenase
MSNPYIASPRRRGSQSPNGANNLNTESIADQVTLQSVPEEFLTAPAVLEEDSAEYGITLVAESLTGDSAKTLKVINPTLNIGLFGFGCVGQGLYDVLNHSQGLKASIGKICVKDKTKPRTIDMEYFTFNKHEVLGSEEHNLIVELTSDADAALEIIGSSLAKGQSVVTAGKKVLAENFELLYRLQQQTGASLLYEAACAGSIPIIRTLEEYYDNELLSSVKGILNGSSNYILSKMEFDKLSYHDALKQAQLAGFAEADPALDVNGTDAKYKLCLLAAHAFGIIVKPSCIFNSGIQNITPFDINYAAQNNCRIKLIAGIAKIGNSTNGSPGGYRAYVLPRFVSRDSPLSNINYEFNGIEVEGVYSDKQFFVGKGAGSHPTGSAVLSDISAITYDYKYGYKKLKKRKDSTVGEGRDRPATEAPDFSQDHRFLESDFTIRLYIRYQGNARDSLALLDIRSIEEEYTSAKGNYIIANVGFKSLFNLLNTPNDLFVCEVLPY